MRLPVTGDPAADQLLEEEPLALLTGMLLDQQVTMEKAFHSPYDLKERLGGDLDATTIAEMDPEKLKAIFAERPALHRFPGSMAGRTGDMCRALVEQYDGKAENVWQRAANGQELLDNLKELPGFGEQKAKIFVALLGKRMGVQPEGWREAAGMYGQDGAYSVADVIDAESLARVREYKQAAKAEAKSAKTKTKAKS